MGNRDKRLHNTAPVDYTADNGITQKLWKMERCFGVRASNIVRASSPGSADVASACNVYI